MLKSFRFLYINYSICILIGFFLDGQNVKASDMDNSYFYKNWLSSTPSSSDTANYPIITTPATAHSFSIYTNRYPSPIIATKTVSQQSLSVIQMSDKNKITIQPIILDSMTVSAIHRPAISAVAPRFRDNATFDIQYLDVQQGLNGSYITTVYQNQTGYLWFGGWPGGISRYDGQSFLEFKEDEGLVYSEINDITEDAQQNLWIATKLGLSKYDGFNFTNFTGDLDLDIKELLVDSKNNLWLATFNHGLVKYDGHSFQQFLLNDDCFTDGINSLVELDGQIWIGTDCGLLKFDGHSFTHYTENAGLIHPEINKLALGKDNKLWIATNQGFSQFDGLHFKNYTLPTAFAEEPLLAILEDTQGQLWLGTYGQGLLKYDGKYYTHYDEQLGLSKNHITDLLEDSAGQLWVTTYGGGVNRCKITTAFGQLGTNLNMAGKVVNEVIEDINHNLWLATEQHGIIQLTKEQGYHYTTANGVPTNSFESILETSNGDLWFGSFDGMGAVKFDGQSFQQYDAKQGLKGQIIWAMLEDNEKNIWFATDNGVSRFDGVAFTHFTTEHGLPSNYTYHLYTDSNHNIYIATEIGWTKYDGTSFKTFTKKDGLPNNSITLTHQDQRGWYWIGTYDGLSVFDGTNFYSFTPAQGLENGKIWALTEDQVGNIWVGTKEGIYLLELPAGGSNNFADLSRTMITPFHRKDGLKAEDIRVNGLHLTHDQKLWVATGKGLDQLDLPEFHQQRKQNIPQLYWNNLQINDVHLDFNNISSFDSTLTKSVAFERATSFNTYPENLQVAHTANSLTFNFIGFNWSTPYQIHYQYQLTGLETDWSKATLRNTAEYRSLPPDNYTFKIRAAGQVGNWSEPLTYDFTVLPPWWLTNWAYLFYTLLLFALLYVIFSFFRKRLLLQNELKLKAAESKRLQELDNFKSRLFTNLTHEFRTPLTVILGMTEQIKTKPKIHLQKGLELIDSNGKNLLRLINQMLDLSKLENQSFKLQWIQGDIVSYLSYLTQSFQSHAAQREVSLQFFTTVDSLIMDYDAEQLKQIVYNLLSNAIKFTPAYGQISVQVSVQQQQLVIVFQDTGIGIAVEHLPRIFDRFYQSPNVLSFSGNGTGIGLAHTQELVQLLGGKITVKSELKRGTKFWVHLPIHHQAPLSTMTGTPVTDLPSTINSVADTQTLSPILKTNAPHILVVEDNPDVMSYLKSCLEDIYQLDFANNGKEGVEKAITKIPDLIVSDVMMPEMNGYELCDVLKKDERTSHIPIILLTAKADVDSKMEGLRKGADVYLAKPFAKAELLLRLEKMTQRQQKLQAYFSKKITDTTPTTVEDLQQEEKKIIQAEHIFIKKVKAIIVEHYSDEQFALPQLCEELNVSRTQLYRKMKALIGISPSKFIRSYRLLQGKKLLETTDLTVAEVAWQVGFKERSHFSKAFNDEFGTYPTEIEK